MLTDREWFKIAAAPPAELQSLRLAAPVHLPAGYLALLSYSNGGEGPLPVSPYWLCLYPAAEVVAIAGEPKNPAFDHLFVSGGNGGGETIALDLRTPKPHPIVAFDMTNTDVEESRVTIATSFTDFLALIGVKAA